MAGSMFHSSFHNIKMHGIKAANLRSHSKLMVLQHIYDNKENNERSHAKLTGGTCFFPHTLCCTEYCN